MRIVPAIPRDPVARFRLLSLWFALFANLIELFEIAIGSTAAVPARAAGVAALVILGAWQMWGYRRRHFPEFSTAFEAVLLVAIGAGASQPLRAMGLFLAALQFRALYVTRRDYWLLPVSYGVARVLGIALSPAPRPYDALSFTVAMQIIGLIIISGTFFLLVAAMDRQAETKRALQRSEARYRVLAAATHDMIYEWNLATDAVEYTDAIRTVFGFADPDVVCTRQWWLSRIHPDDRRIYDAAVAAQFADESTAAPSRYRVRRGDGSEVVVVENAVVQRDAAGARVRVIGSVRDVTAEHRLEGQLLEAQKMEAVGQLAGGVAHDFNNLLTVIGGHVFMLEQSGTLAPDVTRNLEGIMRAAQRAGALTHQLLAFGRKQLLKPTVLNLNVVISDAVRLIGPVMGERIRVVTSLDPLLAPALADAAQIEQVLLNLAINARDAMPDGGTLTIATTNVVLPTGAHVQLTLSDTGTGMSAETLAHLFEPFFTTKAPGRGTGLGLATAYGVIKQSFGHITVASVLGSGSTFTIALPVTKQVVNDAGADSAATTPTFASVSRNASAVNRVLLLVEDDDGVRDFAREVLTRAGFQVLQARHGLEGIAVARAHAYDIDLVVTDVVMPEMGGRQMVEQLRRKRPGLRVLYISGYANDAATRRELGAGEEALLEKPFTARTLRDAVTATANN